MRPTIPVTNTCGSTFLEKWAVVSWTKPFTRQPGNAKTYFSEQFRELHTVEGLKGLQDVYRKLTKRFRFNEYVIKDEFDVFVAFETMNNRGKNSPI